MPVPHHGPFLSWLRPSVVATAQQLSLPSGGFALARPPRAGRGAGAPIALRTAWLRTRGRRGGGGRPPPAGGRAAAAPAGGAPPPPAWPESDRAYVERLLGLSPALAAARDLAQRFAVLVRAHTNDALASWLADAENSELRGFAAGLRGDEQAVRAALTLPWSSGQVEGQVTRLKLVKRQGYGRAKLDLLRARLVRAA